MVLILTSWIYILFTSVNFGIALGKIIKINTSNFVIVSFLGLFSTTILASLWAFFGRINIEFYLFYLMLNFIVFFRYSIEIKTLYSSFIYELKNLPVALRIILFCITVLIIAQCSTAAYILDNESYYIQTIKWINEYGFVKGLANLHIFLGQTSGWHIAQSAFNFPFINVNFNDLSGFSLLLGNIFAVLKLNSYLSNFDKNYLIIGLFPLLNVFFFQFISAPSPDMPVYILTFILFYYFIEFSENISVESYNLITILVFFILYIKLTSIALLLFPIILLALNFKKLFPKILKISIFGVCILSLFIAKNIIITGYPLFPLTYFKFLELDYSIPEKVIAFNFNEARLYDSFLTKKEFYSTNTFQILKKWLFSPKLKGAANIFTTIIIIIIPIFIKKFYNKRAIWIIYIIIIVQMIILLLSSPQFRFFIHFSIFFSLLIFSILIKQKEKILLCYFGSLLPIAFVLLIPNNFSSLTNNKLIANNSPFLEENIFFPNKNSKSSMSYIMVRKGNMNYNSPENHSFFWETGKGSLPCVNQDQIEYFEKRLLLIPQLRGRSLKDGFYSKKNISNE